MSPETIARINPRIVQVVRAAIAFHCRNASEAALVFELRGWEHYSEADPYCIRRNGSDIVYFAEQLPGEWASSRNKNISAIRVDVLDVRALICFSSRASHFNANEALSDSFPTVPDDCLYDFNIG